MQIELLLAIEAQPPAGPPAAEAGAPFEFAQTLAGAEGRGSGPPGAPPPGMVVHPQVEEALPAEPIALGPQLDFLLEDDPTPATALPDGEPELEGFSMDGEEQPKPPAPWAPVAPNFPLQSFATSFFPSAMPLGWLGSIPTLAPSFAGAGPDGAALPTPVRATGMVGATTPEPNASLMTLAAEATAESQSPFATATLASTATEAFEVLEEGKADLAASTQSDAPETLRSIAPRRDIGTQLLTPDQIDALNPIEVRANPSHSREFLIPEGGAVRPPSIQSLVPSSVVSPTMATEPSGTEFGVKPQQGASDPTASPVLDHPDRSQRPTPRDGTSAEHGSSRSPTAEHAGEPAPPMATSGEAASAAEVESMVPREHDVEEIDSTGESDRAEPAGRSEPSVPFGGPHTVRPPSADVDGDRLVVRTPEDARQAIVDRIESLAATRKGGTVRIRMEPHELGSIVVTVKMSASKVDAEITASNDHVRAGLEASRGQLVQAAESKGISLGTLHLGSHLGAESDSSTNPQNQDARQEFERTSNMRSAQGPQVRQVQASVWDLKTTSIDYRI